MNELSEEILAEGWRMLHRWVNEAEKARLIELETLKRESKEPQQ